MISEIIKILEDLAHENQCLLDLDYSSALNNNSEFNKLYKGLFFTNKQLTHMIQLLKVHLKD